MKDNKIPCYTSSENGFGPSKITGGYNGLHLEPLGTNELPDDVVVHKIAIKGMMDRRVQIVSDYNKLSQQLNQETRNNTELMRILMKIPAGWPDNKIPETVINWENSFFDLNDAEGWIDHAVSELDKIAKTEVKDLKALEEYNEGLKFQVEALTKVAADQQYRIQDIMETLAEQVSLINEQKQIINAAQSREDETLALKVQLDSMSNLCQKYARENKKLKKAKK
jgi:hypothetical protein